MEIHSYFKLFDPLWLVTPTLMIVYHSSQYELIFLMLSKKLMRRLHWNILRFSIAYSICVLYNVSHIWVRRCVLKWEFTELGYCRRRGHTTTLYLVSVAVYEGSKKRKLSPATPIYVLVASHLPSLQPQLYLLWHATMEISTRLGHRLVNSWHMQVCSLSQN